MPSLKSCCNEPDDGVYSLVRDGEYMCACVCVYICVNAYQYTCVYDWFY